MTILHLDSSILGDQSVSRVLSAAIVARLKLLQPQTGVKYHDLVVDGPLPLSMAHGAAIRGSEVKDLELAADIAKGSAYIDDLLEADIIVVGAPMYNFTISAQLKAWVDRVVVGGRTFRYGPRGPEGLLPASKKVFLALSRGGIYSGDSPAAALEHQESYLRGMFGFMGLTDVTVFLAEGVGMGPEAKDAAVNNALASIATLTV